MDEPNHLRTVPADSKDSAMSSEVIELIDQEQGSCCSTGCAEGCREAEVDDQTKDLVAAPRVADGAGILAYGHLVVRGDPRLVAMTRNYGSVQGLLQKGRLCYDKRLVNATYYMGGQRIVLAPCLICYDGFGTC